MATTIVWVAWLPFDDDRPIAPNDVTADMGSYSAHVEHYGDEVGGSGLGEQMPELYEIQEVLAWARARSGHVRIRPSWDPATTYLYGDEGLNPGLPVLEV